jgi:hypothetical protein
LEGLGVLCTLLLTGDKGLTDGSFVGVVGFVWEVDFGKGFGKGLTGVIGFKEGNSRTCCVVVWVEVAAWGIACTSV